jgi:membrane associated rhomboid family serine protease
MSSAESRNPISPPHTAMQWPRVHFPELTRRCAHLAQARWPWVVAALVLGIHGLVAWCGGPQGIPRWYLALGLRREAVLDGSLWQVFTYAWLHGSWLHAVLNALCLLIFGASVERILGAGGFLKILALGIVGGALGHLLLADGSKAAFPLVGMSGGCIALLLLITPLSPESRMLPLPVSGRSLGLGILLAESAFALVDPKLGVPGLASIGKSLAAHGLEAWFSVGHACHVGGGLAGFLCARWILRPRPTLQRLRHERTRREAKQRARGRGFTSDPRR